MEVSVQRSLISDEQLPGLWDTLRLMSLKRLCALVLASSPMGRARGEPDMAGTSHITLTWSPGRMLTVVCKEVEEEGKQKDLKIYNTVHLRVTMKTRTRSGQAIPSQEMHIRCKKM